MRFNSLSTVAAKAALLPLLALPVMTSCSDDPDPDPTPEPGSLTMGAFVLTQGNYYNNVEGDLTFFDFADLSSKSNVFGAANGRSLGATPQCGLVYGDKVYLGIYESSTVEIAERAGMKSLKQIKCDSPATGMQPRSMAADGGYVYISMYDGNVARLDTATMAIDKVLKVGPNPDNIAIHKGKLYVPNSDGMNWQAGYGTTASIVNLSDFSVEATVEVPLNPTDFLSVAGKLYLLSKGNYADVESALYEIDENIASIQANATGKGYKRIAPATIVAGSKRDASIFIINSPFVQDGISIEYSRYDVLLSTMNEWAPKDITYPSGMAFDQNTGNYIVSSYVMNGQYPSYDAPGYANYYDMKGNLLKKFTVGAGTPAIFFDVK